MDRLLSNVNLTFIDISIKAIGIFVKVKIKLISSLF